MIPIDLNPLRGHNLDYIEHGLISQSNFKGIVKGAQFLYAVHPTTISLIYMLPPGIPEELRDVGGFSFFFFLGGGGTGESS